MEPKVVYVAVAIAEEYDDVTEEDVINEIVGNFEWCEGAVVLRDDGFGRIIADPKTLVVVGEAGELLKT